MFFGQKLSFLSSGLPHALQQSFWPKPRALHVPMTLSHLQHCQPCSHLLARTWSCWYLSNCPLWRSPFPSRLSGTAGAGSTATSMQVFWNNPSLSARGYVVVVLSPPCCWTAAGAIGRAPGWTFLPCASSPTLSGDGCHFPPQSCCEQP